MAEEWCSQQTKIQYTYLFGGMFVTPEGFVAMVANEGMTRRQNLLKVGILKGKKNPCCLAGFEPGTSTI